ncbi:ferredoxin--NADP reductase [Flexivirga endophytica]|uniref:Ferredoxin--NADP reductase n=1 Tax=Flexivirga endophytica TaxID=1849103 RepID=A0A916WPY1_9MICO|nr:NAD(P)/FAD-dependent oxidoreductase [Flexivirga endophytica]GGB18537.1 ferredoxin--NADP reductase [Flexivirga endophytica]GHB37145.1 ferredoxin--NADP reductase [Flexivirga endophytica]
MSKAQKLATDVLILGAGPTGLYGAYYAGFRGLSTIVVDVLPQVGGQVMALYPEKQIRDVAGLPSIRGRDFIAALKEQADAFSPTYLLGRQAVTVEHSSDAAVVTLDDGTRIEAGAVVITAGIGTPKPRPLQAGSQWLDRGLSYFVVDPEVHRDQDVVIVGGGDSALDWADALSTLATSVTLVHRRSGFRGHAATLARVESSPNTTVLTECEVTAFDGDLANGQLQKVTVTHTSGEERLVAADHVIAALGFISDIGPLRTWGLQLAGRSIQVDRSMRTNVPRVYAAGDVADFDGKVRLMSVGFGEVATAVNHVAVELDPDLNLFPGHSTDES